MTLLVYLSSVAANLGPVAATWLAIVFFYSIMWVCEGERYFGRYRLWPLWLLVGMGLYLILVPQPKEMAVILKVMG